MKRNLSILMVVFALCLLLLQACAGAEEPSEEGLIPPVMANEPYNLALAGAAGSSATVPPLCNNASDANAAAYAQAVVNRVNTERTSRGLAALTVQEELRQAAQKHSIDMACNSFLSHDGSDGSTPFDRIFDFGYDFLDAGENVARGQSSPTAVMDSWMASQGHRDNILYTDFVDIGIGYVYISSDPAGMYHYWTMTLGSR